MDAHMDKLTTSKTPTLV